MEMAAGEAMAKVAGGVVAAAGAVAAGVAATEAVATGAVAAGAAAAGAEQAPCSNGQKKSSAAPRLRVWRCGESDRDTREHKGCKSGRVGHPARSYACATCSAQSQAPWFQQPINKCNVQRQRRHLRQQQRRRRRRRRRRRNNTRRTVQR